jgi:hypothetical protein
MGYQNLEQECGSVPKGTAPIRVYSPFEYGTKLGARHEESERLFVSNSLDLRKTWIRQFGGTGSVPSEVKKQKAQGSNTVLLIGSETLSPNLWEKLGEAPRG